jgi:hypothetical protein
VGLFGDDEITTQQHLDIEDIRDDLLVLKNGVVSLVMETTALNFDLLSEEEQDAKIDAFAAVLNSLNFPLQIVVSTSRKDVTGYIERLEIHKNRQINAALKRQIAIYMQFIKNLTVHNEILDKRFFVVVPSIVGDITRTSVWKQMFGKPSKITNLGRVLEQAKVKLYPKRDHITKQLKRMQIQARQLSSDELIRLYYSLYDPDRVGFERLNIRSEDLTTGLVSAMTDETEALIQSRRQKRPEEK